MNTRFAPGATALVSCALGPALTIAGLVPLATELQVSAGSAGVVRSVTWSPTPSSSANVNGPVCVVIAALVAPPAPAPPVVPAPGVPIVASGTSRVTAMCIFAGAAVGDPDCTSMSTVAAPVADRSRSYCTAGACAVPLIFTARVYGARPPLTSTISVDCSGTRAVACATPLTGAPSSTPNVLPPASKRGRTLRSPPPCCTSAASKSPQMPVVRSRPISSSCAPHSNARLRSPSGATKTRASGR